MFKSKQAAKAFGRKHKPKGCKWKVKVYQSCGWRVRFCANGVSVYVRQKSDPIEFYAKIPENLSPELEGSGGILWTEQGLSIAEPTVLGAVKHAFNNFRHVTNQTLAVWQELDAAVAEAINQ